MIYFCYSVKMNIKVATKISHLLYIALMLAKTTKQYESFNENSKAKKDKNELRKGKKRLKRGKCSIDMGEKNKNGRERQ